MIHKWYKVVNAHAVSVIYSRSSVLYMDVITSASGPARSVFLLTTPSQHPVPAGVLHIPPHTSHPRWASARAGRHRPPPINLLLVLLSLSLIFFLYFFLCLLLLLLLLSRDRTELHLQPLSPPSTSLRPPTPLCFHQASSVYTRAFFQPATLTPAGQKGETTLKNPLRAPGLSELARSD